MRTAIFGGTGFVGSYLIDALLERGHLPQVLVRPGSEHKLRQAARCHAVAGAIDDDAAVAAALRGCEAAVFLIGILREKPAAGITFEALQYEAACRAIDAARAEGVRRFLLMSANGARADGTRYQRTKFAAERYLRESGLDGTVFRPSVIFGDPRGRMEFATQMRDQVIRPPLPAPAFFSGWSPRKGSFSMTPVPVRDVAQAMANALERPQAVGRTIGLGGSAELRWPEIVRTLAAACGRRKRIVPVPAGPVGVAAALLGRFAFFPLTREQLTMLLEGNSVSPERVRELLGVNPGPFDVSALAYLRN